MSASSEQEETAVVIDNGTGMMKAGFAGDDAPRAVFPTIVGRDAKKNVYVGDRAESMSGLLKTRPIKRGIITNWNDMEQVWRHTFVEELRIKPENHSVLMTEAPLNPKINREKITQIMFETFNVPNFYVIVSALLAQYASGRGIGIVMDAGYGSIVAVPTYEGYCLPHAVCKLDIGGKDLNEYLQILFRNQQYFVELEDIQEIMQKKTVSVSVDNTEKSYKLPDGNVIKSEKELVRFAVEALFKPSLIYGSMQLMGMNEENRRVLVNGYSRKYGAKNMYGDVVDVLCKYASDKEKQYGLDELVYTSVMKCDIDIRRDLWSNIIVCGGYSMFEGLADRLQNGIKNNCFQSTQLKYRLKVIAPPERRYSVWIGGSILASLSTFEEMWISRQEYDEFGPSIVHRKCT